MSTQQPKSKVNYQGSSYRFVGAAKKTFDTRYLKHDGVVFYVYALLISKSEPKVAGFKKVKSVPKEVASHLVDEQKEAAKEAAKKGQLWFLKIEGEGWTWGDGKMGKKLPALQAVLNYLKKFESKDTVGGVEALYIEINNKWVG